VVNRFPAEGQHTLVVFAADPEIKRRVQKLAHEAHWRVIGCDQPREIAARVNTESGSRISAVLAALPSSSNSACEIARNLKVRHPEVPVVISTRPKPIVDLVQLLRAGVDAILLEPLTAERLTQALEGISASRLLDDFDVAPPSEKPGYRSDFSSMIGSDSAFRAEIAKAALAARGHEHMVIEGASGTGKTMLAKAVQATSLRASMPLQRLNLREMVHSDIDAILFGHERGAYLGAFERRPSIFQSCDGGTLVLDGIEQLSLPQQRKLAQTITACRVQPHGAGYSLQVDVRIIALSRRSLRKATEAGAFSTDLWASIGATHLVLPTLRQRLGDIDLLAQHFFAKFAQEADLGDLVLSQDAVTLLQTFRWPGNVRQLQAVLLRAATFSQGRVLTAGDFPHLRDAVLDHYGPGWRSASALVDLDHLDVYTSDGDLRTLADIEADVIRLAIKHYRGQMSQVARRLGIGRSTLYRKIAELGLGRSQAEY
jgi:DNA-binding NtrC family response regulator